MKSWKIVLKNYKGEDYIAFFKNYEIAKKNFDRLRELNKDMPAFQIDSSGTDMSWYDDNGYDTDVYLISGPEIYGEIIF